MFKAISITNDGHYRAELTRLDDDALPPGDVTVDVEWSTLNYKDALALTGRSPVVRRFPMVPGIDFAGRVRSSDHPGFSPGDAVLLTGFGHGETEWGGHAGRARVSGERLIHLPKGLGSRGAMVIGTAGLTAMLAILALERNGVIAGDGEVVVSGASGGLGSMAVRLLALRGYEVTASTGKSHAHDYLRRLGAARIIDRAELALPGKPLGRERWAGGIDTVGGHTLANICATTAQGGTVAACGLADSMELPGSVAPFILRGVTLAGIDSVFCPMNLRKQAWNELARLLDPDDEAAPEADIPREIAFEEMLDLAPRLLDGQVRGRLVVRM